MRVVLEFKGNWSSLVESGFKVCMQLIIRLATLLSQYTVYCDLLLSASSAASGLRVAVRVCMIRRSNMFQGTIDIEIPRASVVSQANVYIYLITQISKSGLVSL